jgi:hypothetical protein
VLNAKMGRQTDRKTMAIKIYGQMERWKDENGARGRE